MVIIGRASAWISAEEAGRADREGRRALLGHRHAAVAGGVGERFDAASHDRSTVGHGVLPADFVLGTSGLELALVHAVVISVQVPGRAADDAVVEVIGIGGAKAGEGRRPRDDPGEEIAAERDLVDEAHALGCLTAVEVFERRVARPEGTLHEARSPFWGAWSGLQEIARRAHEVEHVGAIKVEVGRASRTVEERGTAEFRVRRDGRVLLAGVGLEGTVVRVRNFKGRREVHLDAAVIGIRQGREGPRSDVMPQRFAGGDHRIAGGGVADFICPEREGVAVLDGAHQQGIPLARRGDVRLAPEAESEGRRQERGASEVSLVGRLDGFDGTTLCGGRAEAGIPIGDRSETPASGRDGVSVREIGLGLEAFVADPESIASVDAGGDAAESGGARERNGQGVDLTRILEAETIDASG